MIDGESDSETRRSILGSDGMTKSDCSLSAFKYSLSAS